MDLLSGDLQKKTNEQVRIMQKIIKASIAQLKISKITENNQIQLNYPCQHFDAQNSKIQPPILNFTQRKLTYWQQ